MSLFFDSPAREDIQIYNMASPQSKPSPSKRRIFTPMSPNVAPKRKGLKRAKTCFSPNFNVVASDWADREHVPNTQSPIRKLRRVATADRFIPSRQSTSGKLCTEDTAPQANASPQTHIRAQSSKFYQSSVAEACGLDVNSRILQFQPAAPERKPSVCLFRDVEYITGKKFNGLIKPSAAAARARKVPSAPERVLDAPGLVDDFYLNLIAWSKFNLLAIALDDSVYIWNADSGSVGLLCECDMMVTSVRWSEDGSYISIGRDDGLIEVWDIENNTKLRTMKGHTTRVGAQSWSSHIVTSGCRAGEIFNHDVRIASSITQEFKSHTAEVCGLEWRADGAQFASGGNDNIVNIWDARSPVPQFTKKNHTAAIKALSWCPSQPSLLATGGGSSDRHIHFWNTTTGSRVNSIEVGSQVSSLRWGFANGTGREIAATHGYPNNSISVYAYPSLQKTGEISQAHDSRILHSALSPDGATLATVAGDENLKFWNLFDICRGKKEEGGLEDKDIGKVMTIR